MDDGAGVLVAWVLESKCHHLRCLHQCLRGCLAKNHTALGIMGDATCGGAIGGDVADWNHMTSFKKDWAACRVCLVQTEGRS